MMCAVPHAVRRRIKRKRQESGISPAGRDMTAPRSIYVSYLYHIKFEKEAYEDRMCIYINEETAGLIYAYLFRK